MSLPYVIAIRQCPASLSYIIVMRNCHMSLSYVFRDHYTAMVTSASRAVGFKMRNCKNFSNLDVLKSLYFSLVRSRLEYASVVWSPRERCHIDRIESVQRRYLKYLYLKQHNEYPSRGASHELLLLQMEVQSLGLRRRALDLCFLRSLVQGTADCSFLLNKLGFYVPRKNSKLKYTFYVESARTDYNKYAPINRIYVEANNMLLDIF